MALLNILQFPDPRLKKVAETVTIFDQDITQLTQDMLETLYRSQGVGLAAIQVNVQKRVVVIDVSKHGSQPICLINPEILNKRGSIDWEEGCLSFPGAYAKVNRAKEVDIRYFDEVGLLKELSAEGLLAICIQHEIDHLNGITFFDYLSPLKQSLLRKKLDKVRRRFL